MIVAYCFKLDEWKTIVKLIKKSDWSESKISSFYRDESPYDLIYLSFNFIFISHVLIYNLIAWQVVLFVAFKYKNLVEYLKCPAKFEPYDLIVGRELTELSRLIGKFNKVFGSYLFFRIILLVVNILILVCHYMKTTFGIRRFIATSAIECYNTIFCLTFILACEKSEVYFEDLIQTCIYLQVEAGEENARKLTNWAKELRPKFNAAGFFLIHQKILTTVFSNVAMYLIIILQFKFSTL
ncbi:unnamed protein product [Phyllotreta striolata]|uniref:Uncharacterized protein n=1 Tax=Phyllotreta striolata TaxID=444603 RepID=A0A9N9TPN5_PHYSR|nr:unnamed protein product [Phyllotreta striolata]